MAHSHDVVTDPFTQSLIKIKAAQLCRRTDFSRSDADDLKQGMLLYLVEKQHLFDPARGNLEAFVINAVNTWVRMELRFRGRNKRRGNLNAISLEGTIIEFDGEADTLSAMIGSADLERRTHSVSRSPIDLIEIVDAARHVLDKLSRSERALLTQVVAHGVAGTARKRRVSRRQIENAIARMRARFENSGLGAD